VREDAAEALDPFGCPELIATADAVSSALQMVFRSVEFTKFCHRWVQELVPFKEEYLATLEENIPFILQVNNSFNEHIQSSKRVLLAVVHSASQESLLRFKLFQPLMRHHHPDVDDIFVELIDHCLKENKLPLLHSLAETGLIGYLIGALQANGPLIDRKIMKSLSLMMDLDPKYVKEK
jgi:hypothetical protein